jgi:hypothetical protein
MQIPSDFHMGEFQLRILARFQLSVILTHNKVSLLKAINV